MYSTAITHAANPDVNALIAELDRYQEALYPEESNHLLDLSQLPSEQLIVMLIRKGEEAVGCGAIVLGEEDRVR